MMYTRMLLRFFLLGAVLIGPTSAFAGFETYTPNWPNDAASVNEKVCLDKTTSSTTISTKTNNGCEEELPLPGVNQDSRIDELNRLYVKVGGIFVTEQIRKIDNLSTGGLTGAWLISNNVSKDYITWEAGVGSKTKMLRWELNYIYNKVLHYSPSPIFAGLPENLTASATNNTLWLNLYWDWNTDKFWYFRPYVGVMGGFAWNQTRSTMTGGIGNGVSQTHSNYSVAWGATIGARIPFWTRWFCYFDYKYMNQGHTRFVDSTGFMQLKGTYVLKAFGLGVQYLLG